MDVPVQSSPPCSTSQVPRPTHPIPTPSQPPPPSQAALPSQGPPPPRLGVLVEATQPFAVNDDIAGMLRWLLGGKVGGEDRVREVIVSQDRTRAIVEFVYPGVIQQLLSTSTDFLDPLSKQPLRLTQIDLTTLCLVVTGFPLNVNESALESHFQGEANDQQIHSVQMSADRESAMVTFMCPTVAIELAGKETQLFGVNLHLELGGLFACPFSTTADSSDALCVQGLPEAMLNNPQMLPETFKKQGIGSEADDCSIVQGLGYLTFTDPSAVQAITNNPPTKTFMSGSVLHTSATSQLPVPPQVSPTGPREAGGVSDTPTYGKLPGNVSPHSKRPVTAPVRVSSRPPVPHQRHFTSDGTDGPSPSNGTLKNQPRKYQGDQYPHHQGQQQQQQQHSYNEPMHHSASFPDGVGTTTPTSYSQQLPYSPHGTPPYSGQPQGGRNTATTVQSGAPVQQGPQEVAHYPTAYPIATAPAGLCRKVKVSDLPKEARNQTILKFYFQSLAGLVASVELFKDSAVVTLENPTSMDRLLQLSRTTPLEGVVLALSALEPSDTVLVSGLNDTTPDVLVKFMLAEYSEHYECVESVKRISPTHALVIFKSPDSVQKITSKPLIEVEGLQLSVKEYYTFMDTSEIIDPSSIKPDGPLKPNDPPTLTLTQVVHTPQRDSLTKEQHFYMKNSLSEFNDTLKSLRASADIEKVGKDYFVVISPLEGSGSIDEWKDNIAAALKEHFEELSIETINFPNKDAKSDIQDILYDQMDSVLVVKRSPDSFIIAGSKEIITDICKKVAEMCVQVTVRATQIRRKYVKFLEKFYCHEILKLVNKTSVHDIQFNSDNGLITVTANPYGHTEVKEVIQQNVKRALEKALKISQAAYKLLSSQRGAKKLNEIFVVSGSQIVYDMEQVQIPGDVHYYICFLSKDVEFLKKVKKSVKLYVHEVAFATSPAKIRVCSSKEWRDFISTLSEEYFVSITAQEASIVITGEQLACNDISERVIRFLEKHTNIEERVTVSQSEWFVINGSFSNEVKEINDQAKKKQVQIEWPKPNLKVSSLAIVISGEPARVVDDIKVQVTMLLQKVCKKESIITGVPAVVHVLASMEDKLRLLETDEKVQIEVTLENGDSNGSEAAAQVKGEFPRQVCAGTSSSGSRVSVYTGDFAQNAPVGVIVNFVTSDPNTQVGCLKHLLESGGAEAMEDFKQKVSQFRKLKSGMVFKTRHGQLKCSQLVHCVLPSWRSAETYANKERIIDEALLEVIKDTAHSTSGSILITPLTSAPLHYPVNLFVRFIMDAVTNHSELQVSVYVEELHHANEFQDAFQTRKYLIHQKVPLGSPLLAAKKEKPAPLAASVKTISSNLGNFITIVNGDLLQQQADVYINSTNTNLNLKQGQLSQLLLNACGDELQKECSKHAPLKPGQVAVTGAINLKCNQIFHIALPRYKTANSERMFRETVRQILRIAKNSSVSSIAIPSLGVANLGYPESVSAKILFQEVIAFHSQYPSSIQKFIFVIYEKNVFQAFSKEFAQREATAQAPPTASPPAAVAPPTGSTTLIIAQGNIAEESTDIIVNTTSEDMTLNKSAVSRAILEKAGDELQKTCKHYVENGMRLDHGQIVVTPAVGKLRCRKIIHAHVPHQGSIATSSTHHCQLIEKIVIDCLQTAESEKMESISFPAFGLGAGGYSVEQVAEPMLKAFQKFGQTHPKSVKSIRVVIYDPDLYKQFNDLYCKFFGRSSLGPRRPPRLWNRLVGSSHKVKNESQELQVGGVASIKAPPIPQSIPNSTVIFTIFTASNDQCEKIEKHLKKLISDMSTTTKIVGVHIEQLIDDDLKDIFQIGEEHGVQVKMMAVIKELHISGEISKVKEAHGEIHKILSDISMIKLCDFEWSSADDDGRFEVYPPEASMRLERAFNKGLKAIELTVDNVVVLIDIQNRMETDKTTRKKKKISRVNNFMEYPLTWETPHMAGGKREPMTRIEVDSGTPEYVEAVKEFEESLTKGGVKYSIEKLERIENITEYAKHITLKKSIRVKHMKETLVKRLFHGSKQESLEKIAVQGFNRIFAADANAAYYGKGVYFAVQSSFSAQDKYAVPDSSGLRYMFVCSVIIGEYTKGNKDMKIAPPLMSGSNQVFDTLVDNVNSPTIFVAMTDAQAYPEYLITFKKLK